MKNNILKYLITTACTGLSMWVIAGLWHNLILPVLNNSFDAHEKGIGVMLIAYFILAAFMVYLFDRGEFRENKLLGGVKLGIAIGVIWVFPHGLVMAAAHNTSIIYEIKNTIWHIVEQGIGGGVLAFVWSRVSKAEAT